MQLTLLTSRVGSSCLTSAVSRSVSYWPQPSLKMTHMITAGWLARPSTMACNSASNCWAVAGEVWPPPLGMSCQTSSPRLVAPVIPAVRLDLDVLPRGVEAQLLGHLDVVAEGLVGRGRVDPVRPVALIQRADLEHRLAVEHQADVALRVLAQGDLPHAEIAADGIDRLAGLAERHLQVVQERLVRRPELGLGNRKGQFAPCRAGRTGNLPAAIQDDGLDRIGVGRAAGDHRQPHDAAIHVGRYRQPDDARRRHRLDPYRLPDARRGRVGQRAEGFQVAGDLLALGLAAARRVENATTRSCGPLGRQSVGNVEGEAS